MNCSAAIKLAKTSLGPCGRAMSSMVTLSKSLSQCLMKALIYARFNGSPMSMEEPLMWPELRMIVGGGLSSVVCASEVGGSWWVGVAIWCCSECEALAASFSPLSMAFRATFASPATSDAATSSVALAGLGLTFIDVGYIEHNYLWEYSCAVHHPLGLGALGQKRLMLWSWPRLLLFLCFRGWVGGLIQRHGTGDWRHIINLWRHCLIFLLGGVGGTSVALWSLLFLLLWGICSCSFLSLLLCSFSTFCLCSFQICLSGLRLLLLLKKLIWSGHWGGVFYTIFWFRPLLLIFRAIVPIMQTIPWSLECKLHLILHMKLMEVIPFSCPMSSDGLQPIFPLPSCFLRGCLEASFGRNALSCIVLLLPPTLMFWWRLMLILIIWTAGRRSGGFPFLWLHRSGIWLLWTLGRLIQSSVALLCKLKISIFCGVSRNHLEITYEEK